MTTYRTPGGPTVMALGGFTFRALGGLTYNGLTRDLDTSWAEIAVVDGFNAQQWTGPKNDVVTISGVLFPEEFGGMGSLNGIRSAAIAGIPMMLVTAAGSVHGMHTIQGVGEDQTFHDAQGRPRQDAYDIKLKKYSAGGGLLSLF